MDLLPGTNRSMEALLRSVTYGRAAVPRVPRDWAAAPTIAISRQAGARGTTIARAVGERLGWRVYDHELVEQIARDVNVRTNVLDGLDERSTNWLQDCLVSLAGQPWLTQGSYCHHLVRTLFCLAQQGRCVIVGRGAAQVLPGSTTLRVRLVASLEDRIRAVSQERGLSPREAARYVERTDHERVRFVKEHFHRDPVDALQYDLMLNSSRFTVEQCTDLIVQALGRWRVRVEATAPTSSRLAPQTVPA
jgi:cytidylate kinase